MEEGDIMDYHGLKRKQLQALCKKHGVPANLSNREMADQLCLILKEKKNIISHEKLSEKGITDDTEGLTKVVKKVRFSPENETFFYEVSGWKSGYGQSDVNGGLNRRQLRSRAVVVENFAGDVGVTRKNAIRRCSKKAKDGIHEEIVGVREDTKVGKSSKGRGRATWSHVQSDYRASGIGEPQEKCEKDPQPEEPYKGKGRYTLRQKSSTCREGRAEGEVLAVGGAETDGFNESDGQVIPRLNRRQLRSRNVVARNDSKDLAVSGKNLILIDTKKASGEGSQENVISKQDVKHDKILKTSRRITRSLAGLRSKASCSEDITSKFKMVPQLEQQELIEDSLMLKSNAPPKVISVNEITAEYGVELDKSLRQAIRHATKNKCSDTQSGIASKTKVANRMTTLQTKNARNGFGGELEVNKETLQEEEPLKGRRKSVVSLKAKVRSNRFKDKQETMKGARDDDSKGASELGVIPESSKESEMVSNVSIHSGPFRRTRQNTVLSKSTAITDIEMETDQTFGNKEVHMFKEQPRRSGRNALNDILDANTSKMNGIFSGEKSKKQRKCRRDPVLEETSMSESKTFMERPGRRSSCNASKDLIEVAGALGKVVGRRHNTRSTVSIIEVEVPSWESNGFATAVQDVSYKKQALESSNNKRKRFTQYSVSKKQHHPVDVVITDCDVVEAMDTAVNFGESLGSMSIKMSSVTTDQIAVNSANKSNDVSEGCSLVGINDIPKSSRSQACNSLEQTCDLGDRNSIELEVGESENRTTHVVSSEITSPAADFSTANKLNDLTQTSNSLYLEKLLEAEEPSTARNTSHGNDDAKYSNRGKLTSIYKGKNLVKSEDSKSMVTKPAVLEADFVEHQHELIEERSFEETAEISVINVNDGEIIACKSNSFVVTDIQEVTVASHLIINQPHEEKTEKIQQTGGGGNAKEAILCRLASECKEGDEASSEKTTENKRNFIDRDEFAEGKSSILHEETEEIIGINPSDGEGLACTDNYFEDIEIQEVSVASHRITNQTREEKAEKFQQTTHHDNAKEAILCGLASEHEGLENSHQSCTPLCDNEGNLTEISEEMIRGGAIFVCNAVDAIRAQVNTEITGESLVAKQKENEGLVLNVNNVFEETKHSMHGLLNKDGITLITPGDIVPGSIDHGIFSNETIRLQSHGKDEKVFSHGTNNLSSCKNSLSLDDDIQENSQTNLSEDRKDVFKEDANEESLTGFVTEIVQHGTEDVDTEATRISDKVLHKLIEDCSLEKRTEVQASVNDNISNTLAPEQFVLVPDLDLVSQDIHDYTDLAGERSHNVDIGMDLLFNEDHGASRGISNNGLNKVSDPNLQECGPEVSDTEKAACTSLTEISFEETETPYETVAETMTKPVKRNERVDMFKEEELDAEQCAELHINQDLATKDINDKDLPEESYVEQGADFVGKECADYPPVGMGHENVPLSMNDTGGANLTELLIKTTEAFIEKAVDIIVTPYECAKGLDRFMQDKSESEERNSDADGIHSSVSAEATFRHSVEKEDRDLNDASISNSEFVADGVVHITIERTDLLEEIDNRETFAQQAVVPDVLNQTASAEFETVEERTNDVLGPLPLINASNDIDKYQEEDVQQLDINASFTFDNLMPVHGQVSKNMEDVGTPHSHFITTKDNNSDAGKENSVKNSPQDSADGITNDLMSRKYMNVDASDDSIFSNNGCADKENAANDANKLSIGGEVGSKNFEGSNKFEDNSKGLKANVRTIDCKADALNDALMESDFGDGVDLSPLDKPSCSNGSKSIVRVVDKEVHLKMPHDINVAPEIEKLQAISSLTPTMAANCTFSPMDAYSSHRKNESKLMENQVESPQFMNWEINRFLGGGEQILAEELAESSLNANLTAVKVVKAEKNMSMTTDEQADIQVTENQLCQHYLRTRPLVSDKPSGNMEEPIQQNDPSPISQAKDCESHVVKSRITADHIQVEDIAVCSDVSDGLVAGVPLDNEGLKFTNEKMNVLEEVENERTSSPLTPIMLHTDGKKLEEPSFETTGTILQRIFASSSDFEKRNFQEINSFSCAASEESQFNASFSASFLYDQSVCKEIYEDEKSCPDNSNDVEREEAVDEDGEKDGNTFARSETDNLSAQGNARDTQNVIIMLFDKQEENEASESNIDSDMLTTGEINLLPGPSEQDEITEGLESEAINLTREDTGEASEKAWTTETVAMLKSPWTSKAIQSTADATAEDARTCGPKLLSPQQKTTDSRAKGSRTLFAKTNSLMKKESYRSTSISKTPRNFIHDMKENIPSTKAEKTSNITAQKAFSKRRALEDLRKN